MSLSTSVHHRVIISSHMLAFTVMVYKCVQQCVDSWLHSMHSISQHMHGEGSQSAHVCTCAPHVTQTQLGRLCKPVSWHRRTTGGQGYHLLPCTCYHGGGAMVGILPAGHLTDMTPVPVAGYVSSHPHMGSQRTAHSRPHRVEAGSWRCCHMHWTLAQHLASQQTAPGQPADSLPRHPEATASHQCTGGHGAGGGASAGLRVCSRALQEQ